MLLISGSVTLFFVVAELLTSASSCRTYNGKLGTCVKNDLKQYCPHFIPLIEQHGYSIIRLCPVQGEICCPPPTTRRRCTLSEFKCDNGQCIEAQERCNGRVDCSDASDEKRSTCQVFSDCSLKNGNQGTCVTNDLLRNCPHLPALIREQGYGVLSLCGQRHTKICCPHERPITIHQPNPTKPVVHLGPNAISCGTSRYSRPTGSRLKRSTKCEGSDGTSQDLNIVNHIVGGDELAPNSQPWAALLGVKQGRYRVKWQCGGVLVSDRHIVTAAHCFTKNPDPKDWIIRLGEHNIRDFRDSSHQDFIPESISTNGFNGRALNNDIAIVKIGPSVRFSDTINRACLPEKPLTRSGEGLVIGWGDRDFGGCPSNVLLGVNLTLMSQVACEKTYENVWPRFLRVIRLPNGVSDDLFCAASESDQKDACQGDSGSPFLTLDYRRRYTAAGIVSAGQGCGHPGNPGVYTDIYSHLNWIRQIINSN